MPSKQLDLWARTQLDAMKPGELLPTDGQLASTFALSIRTVRRVMGRMRQEGIVERSHGRASRKPGEAPAPNLTRAIGSVQRVVDDLNRAIACGEIRFGTLLPQVKFLSHQYRVGDKTILRAYRILEQQGVAVKAGKRYQVGEVAIFSICEPRHTAWLVVETMDQGPLIFTDGDLGLAYQKFEQELRNHGIVLRLCDWATLHRMIPGWKAEQKFPIGIAFWRLYEDSSEEFNQMLRPLVDRGDSMVVRVLFDLGDVKAISSFAYKCQCFSRGNLTTNRARSIATHLARHRYDTVVLVQGNIDPEAEYRAQYLRFLKVAMEIRAQAIFQGDIRHVAVMPDAIVDRKELLADIRQKGSSYLGYLTKKYATKAGCTAESMVDRVEIVSGFEAVLQIRPKRSLWICTTAHIASQALDALASHRVVVPGEVALIALERTPAFLHLGLSTCAFDPDQAGYLMAHAIIGDFEPEKTSQGYLHIPCQVVHRLTSSS